MIVPKALNIIQNRTTLTDAEWSEMVNAFKTIKLLTRTSLGEIAARCAFEGAKIALAQITEKKHV